MAKASKSLNEVMPDKQHKLCLCRPRCYLPLIHGKICKAVRKTDNFDWHEVDTLFLGTCARCVTKLTTLSRAKRRFVPPDAEPKACVARQVHIRAQPFPCLNLRGRD